MTVTIDDDLAARLHAVRDKGESIDMAANAAIADALKHWEREDAARAEAQAILNGPRHPYDPETTYQKYREKYGWSDLSHLSGEELIEDAERYVAAMSPDVREQMEREGLL